MATEEAVNELKQQGALEASRDPESSVTADDAEKKVLEESKAAGVDAFRFDPDATPAEKKAQAREVSKSNQRYGPQTSLTFLMTGCARRLPLQTKERRGPGDRSRRRQQA